MKTNEWSKRLGAASLVSAMLFTGNAVVQAPPDGPEETLAVVATAPGETEETMPVQTEASPLWLACEEIAGRADGQHIFVYDAEALQMRYCSTETLDKLYPASITKVYAALVALMYLPPDQIVTAGSELALVPSDSSRAYINRGSRLTVKMLVEAMLLPSGSDASYVLAAAAGRAIREDESLDGETAVAAFISELNRAAAGVGLKNSHFVNPDGYHHEDHYMCPGDVAVVAALALGDPVISQYMGLQQDAVVFESGEHITWYNSNQLITPTSPYYSEYATGMKTGYTDGSGHCLLAVFQGDIVVGIFGSQERYPRYQTAIELFEACA